MNCTIGTEKELMPASNQGSALHVDTSLKHVVTPGATRFKLWGELSPSQSPQLIVVYESCRMACSLLAMCTYESGILCGGIFRQQEIRLYVRAV